jgi:hypothetical protein
MNFYQAVWFRTLKAKRLSTRSLDTRWSRLPCVNLSFCLASEVINTSADCSVSCWLLCPVITSDILRIRWPHPRSCPRTYSEKVRPISYSDLIHAPGYCSSLAYVQRSSRALGTHEGDEEDAIADDFSAYASSPPRDHPAHVAP